MKLIEDLQQIKAPFKNAVISIGNFDGVHIGHQALFHQVIEKAEAIGGTSVAMTFEPHPIRVLAKNGRLPLITMYEQKVELIARTGIDVLICVPFTQTFAEISAHDFVSELLVKKIGTKAIVVGQDYAFGKNREGDLNFLQAYGKDLDFEVIVVDWIDSPQSHQMRTSSTRIRELVEQGLVDEAQKMLGRHYQIRGTVEYGRNRGGRLLGFPTANIFLQDELCPKTGVYAVTVECNDAKYLGVANIGYSPTFDDHQFTVEVHILDFDADIYQQKIRVNFVNRIRDEIKFGGIDELSDQITNDIQVARDLLSL
jgi:riboflavin kinase / FMN adenylyltransferase